MNGSGNRRRVGTLVALSGALAVTLTGCSSSVAASDVGSAIATQLKAQNLTIDDDDVACPEDLPAEVGRSITCTFTSDGEAYDAEAKVTAVNGDEVDFDISATPRP